MGTEGWGHDGEAIGLTLSTGKKWKIKLPSISVLDDFLKNSPLLYWFFNKVRYESWIDF